MQISRQLLSRNSYSIGKKKQINFFVLHECVKVLYTFCKKNIATLSETDGLPFIGKVCKLEFDDQIACNKFLNRNWFCDMVVSRKYF